MRSGYVNLIIAAGVFRNAGEWGPIWSSHANMYTSNTSATAYYLTFNATDVYPSLGPDSRFYAFPLRCLSTVLDI